MDALDQMISEKRAEVSGLKDRIKVLEAELAALELAASLRPAAKSGQYPATRPKPSVGKGGGRRKGDISMDWRRILSKVHALKRRVSYEDVSEIAAASGNPLEMASIRDRVRNLVRTGLMEGDASIGFSVTPNAVERFSFANENDPPEGGSLAEVDASVEVSERDDLGTLLG